MKLSEQWQTADWKSEKHVPVIEAPEQVKAGEVFQVKVTLGKEVAHPNKTEHHIRWIALYFKPEGGKFPYEVGLAEFSAHGASTEGPDTSGVYTHHEAVLNLKVDQPGTLLAGAYCNIHGLWENARPLQVQ